MREGVFGWSAQQLAEFLASVADAGTEQEALRIGIERAAEALEAEFGAVIHGGAVVASVGFGSDGVPEGALLDLAAGRCRASDVPGMEAALSATVPLDDESGLLVLARSGNEVFDQDEVGLLRAMGRVLVLTLSSLRVLTTERSLRRESERQAAENRSLLESLLQRQRLLEKTTEIQRAISRRVPLAEVLDTIIEAAAELLGDEVVALRMIHSDDPTETVLVASRGMSSALRDALVRGRVGEGAGGRAITEGRLVVIEGYAQSPDALPDLAIHRLQAAMAAPVHERGTVVGSLVVASFDPGHVYDETAQQMLLAFAEHVSLALMDAKTVDDMLRQALHDSLTGLANRALFLDRLRHRLSRREGAEGAAVLFIDLDGFKNVNDSLGHVAGDEVLVAVASRLEACVRAEDTAARLGGDEFAVLLENVETRGEAARLAERILDSLRAPVQLAGREIVVGASIGVAFGGDGGDDLLRNADLAMYRAKLQGRGRYEFLESAMHRQVLERLQLESDLRSAVERAELELCYQPIIDLRSGSTVALEALVRWRHPSRGLLVPSDFISAAEDTGAIFEIGRWSLRTACREAASWRKCPGIDQRLSVNVNLSPTQLLRPELVDEVAAALADAGLEPRFLVLEITEDVLMRDTERAILQLRALKQLGVRLAVDDFGTGYSSLRYLSDFPLDVLKIAKPFVDRVSEGGGESALARAIVELGGTFGLDVVAEGIERPEQVTALQLLGCSYGQGFLLSEPLPASRVAPLLAVRRELPATLRSLRSAS